MTESDPGLLRLQVPKSFNGKRFDKALAELVESMSGSQLQRLVRGGKVKVDGKKVFRSNFKLRGGECLALRIAEPQTTPQLELEFLLEEPGYLIVNKPPGMLSHGNEKQRTGSVSDFAVERYGALPSFEGEARPGIVHRLDRETSGVMVLARTQDTLGCLRAQFKARTVAKTYTALVHGLPRDDEFEVDLKLAPVAGKLDLQCADRRGKEARTAFRVVRRLERHSIIECKPATGRRHQIRVHLTAAGFPVVGDKLYRPKTQVEHLPGLWHHLLHAAALEFNAPSHTERVRHTAPLPSSFMRIVDLLDDRP